MPFTLLLDGEPCEIEILARKPRLVLAVNGRIYTVEPTASDGMVRIDGETVAFARAEIGDTQFLRMAGRTQALYQHAIAKSARALPPRLNLTFRWINAPGQG